MQIKQQALASQVQKKIAPVYVLIGQDNYLLNDCLHTIKSAIKSKYDCDERVLSLNTAEDWAVLVEEANSYSLFSEAVLLNIFYDKKTIDAAGKKILGNYLKSINSKCFIVIRAPNIPAKNLAWLTNNNETIVVVSYPLSTEAMKQWIVLQFKKNEQSFDSQVPDLIHRYTKGNMLACAQAIEKIALTYPAGTHITAAQALEHLFDQCEHSLYELVEACLQGQADKAIQILRQAANDKTEAILVLWMLAQEARQLLQLSFLINNKGMDFKTACSQLKIWPQRVPLYQLGIKRLSQAYLQQLLHYCQTIDEQVKSSLHTQAWNSLEQLALGLSLGLKAGSR
ncbi:MAG: DNA polymerase III subunit delta [Legionella sp.]